MEKDVSNYLFSLINLYGDMVDHIKENNNIRLLKKPTFYRIRLNNRIISNGNQKSNAFEDYFKYFDYILRSNFPHEVLDNYFENSEDLSAFGVCFQLSDFIDVDGYNGKYSAQKNLIIIDISDRRRLLSIFHELFHMASANRLNLNRIKQGLSFYNSYLDKQAGIKLNEGYTEVLCKRYFGHVGYVNTYPLPYKYVSILEQIVGKEQMEKYYLTADAKGFVTELQKYDTLSEIMYFINEIDYIDELKDPIQVEQLRLSHVSHYLILWYARKLLRAGENFLDPIVQNKIYDFAHQLPEVVNNPRDSLVHYHIDLDKLTGEVIEEIIHNNPSMRHGR